MQESKNIIKYYFDEEHFKLIKGNTFRVLKKFKDKTVDTIFADPPYFLSNGGITCSRWKNGNSK